MKYIYSAAYSPSSTGMIEKRNHILMEHIRRLTFYTPDRSDEYVSAASREINHHLIDALGFSPFQIVFGIEQQVVLECYHQEVMEAVDGLVKEDNLKAKDVHEAMIWREETRDLIED